MHEFTDIPLSLPANLRGEFRAAARRFALPAGKQVLAQGQACTALAFVREGSVRVYLIGEDGREITLYRVGPGESCVLTASCILGGTGFPALAVADRAASGCAVPAATFQGWVARHVFWREYVFRLVGKRMAVVLAQFEAAKFGRLDMRLARHILQQLPPGGGSLRTTQQELANELGSAREVVSRVLNRWQKTNWLRLERGWVHVTDRPSLERCARVG
jgi:CRP/FNR family transcriptional regulator